MNSPQQSQSNLNVAQIRGETKGERRSRKGI
jgi:hypothetical protein